MKLIFNKKLFGQTLHLYRKNKGHTLDAVSVQTGISISTLQRYEIDYNVINFPIEKVLVLCHEYLKMPVNIFTQDLTNPTDILANKEFHTFTSLAQHLTLFNLNTKEIL